MFERVLFEVRARFGRVCEARWIRCDLCLPRLRIHGKTTSKD